MRTRNRVTTGLVSVLGVFWLLGSMPAGAQVLRPKPKHHHMERSKDRREHRPGSEPAQ